MASCCCLQSRPARFSLDAYPTLAGLPTVEGLRRPTQLHLPNAACVRASACLQVCRGSMRARYQRLTRHMAALAADLVMTWRRHCCGDDDYVRHNRRPANGSQVGTCSWLVFTQMRGCCNASAAMPQQQSGGLGRQHLLRRVSSTQFFAPISHCLQAGERLLNFPDAGFERDGALLELMRCAQMPPCTWKMNCCCKCHRE